MPKIVNKQIFNQIQKFIESLVRNGLNLVSKENIRQIEFFLQNASQIEAYRLATSLRYLHIELKRFLFQNPAFNIDRYVFFLINCWLLCYGCGFQDKTLDKALFEKLMGNFPEVQVINKIKFRLIGIELVYLEGAIFGVVLYFISLSKKLNSEILKLNIFQPPKGIINPEVILGLEINNHTFSYKELFYKNFYAANVQYSPQQHILSLNKEKNPTFTLIHSETDFPIDLLTRYQYDAQTLYDEVSEYEYSPFDSPITVMGPILIKNASVMDSIVLKKGQTSKDYSIYQFRLKHYERYPVFIHLKDKPINQVLIDKFQKFHDKKKTIEYIFGKLTLERGKLCLFPLSIIKSKKEDFICLSNIKQDYRKIMKSLYEK